MPLIQISAPQGALNKNDRDALVSQLSDAVLRSEGADPNDQAAQALVWAHYFEGPVGTSYVGGENLEKPPLIIAVTTPEGALSDVSRQKLVEDIGGIVDGFVGSYEGRLNHWAMLYELDEGSWGVGGQIFRLADIQTAMNITPADA